MDTSGGTSLCCQSGKHFRELSWLGDCLIFEEHQPDFLCGKRTIYFGEPTGAVGQEETDAGFQYMSGNLRKAAIQNSPVISRRTPKADGRIN
jgi:hypothetical protein